MNLTTSILRITAALAAALLISGCGRSKQETADSPAPAAPAERAKPAEGRKIEITGDDAMKFSVTEIRAKAGEALAVTLKNVGTMPKFSMGHNWVLLDSGVKVADFANDAAQSVKTDYVPESYKSRIIASTKLLGPGESDTVLFYAPKKVGRYEFLCTFPGHFQVGMKGVLIVDF